MPAVDSSSVLSGPITPPGHPPAPVTPPERDHSTVASSGPFTPSGTPPGPATHNSASDCEEEATMEVCDGSLKEACFSQSELSGPRVGSKRKFKDVHFACDRTCLGKQRKIPDYMRAAAKIQNRWKAFRTKSLYYRYLWLSTEVERFRAFNPNVAEFIALAPLNDNDSD